MSDFGNDETNKLLAKLDVYVNNIKEREGFINSNVEKKIFSSEGGSYIGILYEINIKGNTAEGDKEINLFIKNIIVADLMIFSVKDVYKRELFAYRELSKIFSELQDNANVPELERYKMAYCFEESDKDAIILENLVKRGFKTYFRTQLINIEFTTLAVKQLAKFHGLSLVIEEKKPEFFKRSIESLKQPFKYDELWYNFLKGMIETSTSFLEKDVCEKYGKVISEKINKYPRYLRSENCKVRTLCHGDYRHNNIMIKEKFGEASELIPVDYQMIHCGNPILDFFYLIFWGTDQEFRRKHMNDLKELYYETFGHFLTYFELDVEAVFPRKEFEYQFKDKMDFGVMIATLYVPFLFPSENKGPDPTQPEDILGESSFQVDVGFQERYRGIVDDFIQWGYLD